MFAAARTFIPRAALARSGSLASRRALTVSAVRRNSDAAAHESPSFAQATYLQGLLKEDDAQAPWNQPQVNMVSREVQEFDSSIDSW
ncbi:hypothetical protein GGI07_003982 [Coemansia sp. Benny D115]|nr:hypothetical protein GGI07_003982 [Coemansia sp. Benny D115]